MCIFKSLHWDCDCWTVTHLEHCDKEACWVQMLYPGFVDTCESPPSKCFRLSTQVNETQANSTHSSSSSSSSSSTLASNETLASSSTLGRKHTLASRHTLGRSHMLASSTQASTTHGSNAVRNSMPAPTRRILDFRSSDHPNQEMPRRCLRHR